jgi:hypothetical protein
METAWQRSFLDRLNKVQTQWQRQFDEALDRTIVPVFEDAATFARDNGFRVATPLQEDGRRSFKFELSENAYVLLIFRYTGVGEFEARTECFVPGADPSLTKAVMRILDLDDEWARKHFQTALDNLVDLLAGSRFHKTERSEALATV